MNKHFNINYAEQESDWKDLTIVKLLSEVSDLEDKIDKAIEYIKDNHCACLLDKSIINSKELIDILKGSDSDGYNKE